MKRLSMVAVSLLALYHVFSVLAKDAQGTMRSSNPVMVVVRKLPAASQPAN